MAENIDPFDKTSGNPTNRKSEKIPEVKNSLAQSDPINSKQETETMETHAYHLHRAPGKKIWHYFFEFLMLFFAVFCGFLAENWREQMQEHRREKEFIHSIVQDLKSDTLHSNKTLLQLKKIKSGMDSVMMLISSPGIVDNSNEAYKLWTKYMGIEVFVSNDRTIQQLKSSGELRLIRNKAVSDRIMDYEQTLKKYNTQSNLMYNAVLEVTNISQLFDFISLEKNQNIPVPLTEQGKKSLNQAYAHLQLWNRGMIGLISWLEEVNEEAKKLLIFIQKEYQLE
jgi:hypothetical protein